MNSNSFCLIFCFITSKSKPVFGDSVVVEVVEAFEELIFVGFNGFLRERTLFDFLVVVLPVEVVVEGVVVVVVVLLILIVLTFNFVRFGLVVVMAVLDSFRLNDWIFDRLNGLIVVRVVDGLLVVVVDVVELILDDFEYFSDFVDIFVVLLFLDFLFDTRAVGATTTSSGCFRSLFLVCAISRSMTCANCALVSPLLNFSKSKLTERGRLVDKTFLSITPILSSASSIWSTPSSLSVCQNTC